MIRYVKGFQTSRTFLIPGAQAVELVEDRAEEDGHPEDRVDEGLEVAEPRDGDSEPQAEEQPIRRDDHHDQQRDQDLRAERHESDHQEHEVDHHVVREVDELDAHVAQHEVAERLTRALQGARAGDEDNGGGARQAAEQAEGDVSEPDIGQEASEVGVQELPEDDADADDRGSPSATSATTGRARSAGSDSSRSRPRDSSSSAGVGDPLGCR